MQTFVHSIGTPDCKVLRSYLLIRV